MKDATLPCEAKILKFRVIKYTLEPSSAMIAWRPFRSVLASSAALAEFRGEDFPMAEGSGKANP